MKINLLKKASISAALFFCGAFLALAARGSEAEMKEIASRAEKLRRLAEAPDMERARQVAPLGIALRSSAARSESSKRRKDS